MAANERAPGTYARERYEAGLRRYRRRMRPYYVGLIAGACALLLLIWALRGLDLVSFMTGTVAGSLLALAVWIRDEPPELIAKWSRGAEGETRTGEAIKPLLQEGWKVRHDVDLGRGNADHILLSPSGTAYLLETKSLAGQIHVEAGVVVCRFADDPDAIRRYDLRRPLDSLTERVKAEWARRQGRAAPPLQTIVVLWGRFPQRIASDAGLTYVAGELLADYLKEQEVASQTKTS
jgi:hypothetical protein